MLLLVLLLMLFFGDVVVDVCVMYCFCYLLVVFLFSSAQLGSLSTVKTMTRHIIGVHLPPLSTTSTTLQAT